MSYATRLLLPACLLATLAWPAWCGPSGAAAAPAASAAPPSGAGPLALEWDARLRDERVDDDAFPRDAVADTLRLRLGLAAHFGTGWSGLVEAVGIASGGDRYNSGANGRTGYPTITDPSASGLNQYWLRRDGDALGVQLGRQRLQFDNQRWVGASGWRQYEQTFDAVAVEWRPTERLTLQYDWLDRVHRVAGPDALNRLARERRLDTHLLHAAWTAGSQRVTGYAWMHEDRDVATASTATYGLRWTGSAATAGNGPAWTAEFARQGDYANNPQRFTHSYWLLEPAWTRQGITAKLGWEHLGGNGRHALQTPLATLHAFNGWDDQFNVTPPGGLDDRYASVGGTFGTGPAARRPAWTVAWHDYRADHGGRYGSEWNASLGWPLPQGLAALVKLARYHADGYARDSTKLWLQLEWRGRQDLASGG